MTAFREDLLTRIIRIYGFEHPITLDFAKLCENWAPGVNWDRCLEVLVEAHEDHPQIDEEKDEI